MERFVKRTWADVNLDVLRNNFANIRKIVTKNAKIMCVVKADAYGHGAGYVASALEDCGADWFAVSNIQEAIQLRVCGVDRPILVLGYTPVDMVEKLSNFNISQSIISYKYGLELAQTCRQRNVLIRAHIKLDTGMSRIGFLCNSHNDVLESVKFIQSLYGEPGLNLEGIFTHFAVSDCSGEGKEFTKFQFDRFSLAVKMLEEVGVVIPLRHCCNSGAVIDYSEMAFNMVRAGVILYGLLPSAALKDRLDISPIMQLKTVVCQIKRVSKGTSISYGRTFVAPKDMVVATVPIGYADGYLRALSNKSDMLVCGKRAHVLGRVCMDQLMLDVTDIPEVYEGAEVVVFGKQGTDEISVDELAEKAGTINYELVCLLGKRVSRVYYKNGEKVGQLSYV